MLIKTKRLLLRELTPNDFDELSALLRDSRVMYAYEHTFTLPEVQAWLDRQLERYQTLGFGLWALIHRETGQWLGQAGLTIQKTEIGEVLEVGYLLHCAQWHKGYATEAAEVCVRYAFDTLRAPSVYAIIKPDNLSSIKVAQRIGMSMEGEMSASYFNGSIPHLLYKIEHKNQERSF